HRRAAADRRRRPARAEHAGASTRQGRRDRRALGDARGGAARAVRGARRGRGAQPPRALGAEARERDPAARSAGHGRRPRRVRVGRAPAGRLGLLLLSADGRDRARDAVRRLGRRRAARPRTARVLAVAAAPVRLARSERLRRPARGLVHDGDRATTVRRLRLAADRGCGLRAAGRQRMGDGRALRLGLRRRVRRRRLLPRTPRQGRSAARCDRRPGGPAARRADRGARGIGSMSGDPLSLVWLALIAFGIFMYVLLDGFVLGVGILFPFAPSDRDRDLMMTSVAPIWDGNETWLVLGGVGLFAAFPLAYAVVLPALYLPFVVMLLGLIFRGVTFEFRFKAKRSRKLWDRAFQWGSLTATFTQGLVLGAFVQGFAIEDGRYVGGLFD